MKSDQNATEVIPLVMLFFIQRICCFCFIIQKCNSDNELKALRSQIPVSERSEKVCSLYTAHFLQRSLDTAIFAMDNASSSHDNQISILSLLLIFCKLLERNKLRTVHLKRVSRRKIPTQWCSEYTCHIHLNVAFAAEHVRAKWTKVLQASGSFPLLFGAHTKPQIYSWNFNHNRIFTVNLTFPLIHFQVVPWTVPGGDW